MGDAGAVGMLMVHGRTDYERVAAVYDAGRALPLEWLDAWRRELEPYFSRAASPILDLGSGTGLWAEAFATWFGDKIVAVEPSGAMRRAAAAKELPPEVWLVGGAARSIPLRSDSCACAWLSTVVHHITDLETCAGELRRVLESSGVVLIRNNFGDRLEGIPWLDFFPSARAVASGRWPTVEATVEAFRTAGFEVEGLLSIAETVAADLSAYHDRIRVRANSTLRLISDEEFQDGLTHLREAADRQSDPRRVLEERKLLVLRGAT
jgi:SAM-dependent methyltransferase